MSRNSNHDAQKPIFARRPLLDPDNAQRLIPIQPWAETVECAKLLQTGKAGTLFSEITKHVRGRGAATASLQLETPSASVSPDTPASVDPTTDDADALDGRAAKQPAAAPVETASPRPLVTYSPLVHAHSLQMSIPYGIQHVSSVDNPHKTLRRVLFVPTSSAGPEHFMTMDNQYALVWRNYRIAQRIDVSPEKGGVSGSQRAVKSASFGEAQTLAERQLAASTESHRQQMAKRTRAAFANASCWAYAQPHRIMVVGTHNMELRVVSSTLETQSALKVRSSILAVEYLAELDCILVVVLGMFQLYRLVPNSELHNSSQFHLELVRTVSDFAPTDCLHFAHYSPLENQLFLTMNSELYIYCLSSYRRLVQLSNLHQASITAVTYYAPYQYLVTGARDGRIRVWTAQFSLLYEIADHLDRITALSIAEDHGWRSPGSFPYLLSGSTDGTLRLWSLDSAQCIQKLVVGQPVLGAAFIKMDVFYHYTNASFSVWNLNGFHREFSQLDAPVVSIQRYAQTNKPTAPARLLCCTQDNALHLLNTVTGKRIALGFPIDMSLSVRQAVYFAHFELAYALMTNGQVARYDTRFNPFVLDALWYSSQAKKPDKLTVLLSLDDAALGVAVAWPLLLAGTHNGQIVFINTANGGVQTPITQAHLGPVTHMLFDAPRRLLVTVGSDKRVKLWYLACKVDHGAAQAQVGSRAGTARVSPPHSARQRTVIGTFGSPASNSSSENTVELVLVQVAQFQLDQELTDIALAPTSGTLLLALGVRLVLISSADKRIRAFSPEEPPDIRAPPPVVDLEPLAVNSPSDNHTPIRLVVAHEPLHLFLTVSTTGVVKVWNQNIRLVRELVFGDELYSIGMANMRGDLLVGWRRDLLVVPVQNYLPMNLLSTLIQLECPNDLVETPLAYDESIAFWLYAQSLKRAQGSVAPPDALRISGQTSTSRNESRQHDREVERFWLKATGRTAGLPILTLFDGTNVLQGQSDDEDMDAAHREELIRQATTIIYDGVVPDITDRRWASHLQRLVTRMAAELNVPNPLMPEVGQELPDPARVIVATALLQDDESSLERLLEKGLMRNEHVQRFARNDALIERARRLHQVVLERRAREMAQESGQEDETPSNDSTEPTTASASDSADAPVASVSEAPAGQSREASIDPPAVKGSRRALKATKLRRPPRVSNKESTRHGALENTKPREYINRAQVLRTLAIAKTQSKGNPSARFALAKKHVDDSQAGLSFGTNQVLGAGRKLTLHEFKDILLRRQAQLKDNNKRTEELAQVRKQRQLLEEQQEREAAMEKSRALNRNILQLLESDDEIEQSADSHGDLRTSSHGRPSSAASFAFGKDPNAIQPGSSLDAARQSADRSTGEFNSADAPTITFELSAQHIPTDSGTAVRKSDANIRSSDAAKLHSSSRSKSTLDDGSASLRVGLAPVGDNVSSDSMHSGKSQMLSSAASHSASHQNLELALDPLNAGEFYLLGPEKQALQTHYLLGSSDQVDNGISAQLHDEEWKPRFRPADGSEAAEPALPILDQEATQQDPAIVATVTPAVPDPETASVSPRRQAVSMPMPEPVAAPPRVIPPTLKASAEELADKARAKLAAEAHTALQGTEATSAGAQAAVTELSPLKRPEPQQRRNTATLKDALQKLAHSTTSRAPKPATDAHVSSVISPAASPVSSKSPASEPLPQVAVLAGAAGEQAPQEIVAEIPESCASTNNATVKHDSRPQSSTLKGLATSAQAVTCSRDADATQQSTGPLPPENPGTMRLIEPLADLKRRTSPDQQVVLGHLYRYPAANALPLACIGAMFLQGFRLSVPDKISGQRKHVPRIGGIRPSFVSKFYRPIEQRAPHTAHQRQHDTEIALATNATESEMSLQTICQADWFCMAHHARAGANAPPTGLPLSEVIRTLHYCLAQDGDCLSENVQNSCVALLYISMAYGDELENLAEAILVPMLWMADSTEAQVRAQFAASLKCFPQDSPMVIESLLQLVADPAESVRQLALDSLANFGVRSCVDLFRYFVDRGVQESELMALQVALLQHGHLPINLAQLRAALGISASLVPTHASATEVSDWVCNVQKSTAGSLHVRASSFEATLVADAETLQLEADRISASIRSEAPMIASLSLVQQEDYFVPPSNWSYLARFSNIGGKRGKELQSRTRPASCVSEPSKFDNYSPDDDQLSRADSQNTTRVGTPWLSTKPPLSSNENRSYVRVLSALRRANVTSAKRPPNRSATGQHRASDATLAAASRPGTSYQSDKHRPRSSMSAVGTAPRHAHAKAAPPSFRPSTARALQHIFSLGAS